ncbi:MAG: hypothetical protein WBS19_19485 [Candidatus Korobacteraceae bacterium]
MRFLVRQEDQQSHARTSEPPLSRIDAARVEGSRLLSAGDDAIRQALDGSSESFLRASRQEGGE